MKAYTLIAIALYLLCAVILWLKLSGHPRRLKSPKILLLAPGIVALVIHAFILYNDMVSVEGINLGFYIASSMVAWCVAAFTLTSSMKYPAYILGIIVMPFAAIALALELTQTSVHILPPDSQFGLHAHILISSTNLLPK